MKKAMRVFFLFALAAILLLSTACHGSGEKNAFSVPEEFDTSRNYEITFWAKNDTNKFQTAIYKKAISDFEALYPNITVNMRLYTDYVKIYNDVITNISTDTTPNVCITYPDHIATYLTGQDTVVPLDGLFENEKYGFGGSELKYEAPTFEEMIPGFLGECRIGANYYAVPYMRSTEACYVNKNLVEKLGYELPEMLTWDFVWEVAGKAMEKDKDGNFTVNGQKVMIPVIYKSTDNMMITMLRQLGGEYSNDSGSNLMFNGTTEGILRTVADQTSKKTFSTFKISGYPGNFLNAGQCIFAIDSTAGATWMGTDAPNLDISEDKLVEFETVVLPVPQADPEHPAMISQGPSLCVFNKKDPQEVLASWLFTQYLLTNDVQLAYSQTEGYVPVTYKAGNSSEYAEYFAGRGTDTDTHYAVKLDAAKLLMENLDNSFVTPVFNGSASLRSAAGELIESVTTSVRRKEDTGGNYMTELYEKTASLYRLDQMSSSGAARKDLGKMPLTGVVLLSSLGAAWLLMGIYVLVGALKKKKNHIK